MSLSKTGQQWVEANMGLVGKVIAQEVKCIDRLGVLSYEDLFQTGCIGLCNVAEKYVAHPELASTLAYTYIRNEIFKLLRATTLRRQREFATDTELRYIMRDEADLLPEDNMGLLSLIKQLGMESPATVRKGIEALILHTQGYSYREIGNMMGGVKANLVTAWVAKARAHLRRNEVIAGLRKAV